MALARDEEGRPLAPNGYIADWMKFALRVVIIPVIIGAAVWISSVERRLITVELTRWTLADHNAYAETIRLEQAAVRLQIQEVLRLLSGKLDSDAAPPPDYREEVDRRFDEIRERLRRLEGGETP